MAEFQLIGRRLKAWREAVNKRARDLANESDEDFKEHYWSQWESGRQRISLDMAISLCDRYPGLTLDYIYRGQMGGMPFDLVDAIRGHPVQSLPLARVRRNSKDA